MKLHQTLIALALGTFSLTSSARAQLRSPLWGTLESGPHAVGFTVVDLSDYARAWGHSRDARTGLERELPRPIRVSVWYPAVLATGASMRFRSYVFYNATTRGGAAADAFLSRRDSAAYAHGDFGDDTALVQKLLATRTAARLNAPRTAGQYPLVLYAAGWNSLSPDNTVLAEYLASHGFVVATVPQLPRSVGVAELFVSAADLDVQKRDLDFALGFLVASAPNVNASAIALMGYSMGGVVQLVQSEHRANIRALIGLDPSYLDARWTNFTASLDGFDPWKLRMPVLMLRSGDAESREQSTAILDRLTYQERYVGAVGMTNHGDFSDYPAIVAGVGATFPNGESLSAALESHNDIDRCVLAFLQATVGPSSPRSTKFEPARCAHIPLIALPAIPIPTTDQLLDSLSMAGYDRTRAMIQTLTAKYAGITVVNESELNARAYGLLGDGRHKSAVDAFLLNTIAHPNSANAYDSLGDGYLSIGDSVAYIAALRKVLEVVDHDSSLSGAAKEGLRTRARQALDSIKPPRAVRRQTRIWL